MRLRPPGERDLPLFVRWFNDPEVRYWLSMSDGPELTLESEREWYEEMRGDPAQVIWCIETEEGQPIGNLGLHAIDEAQGRATLGISICEKGQWSRGYGTEAIRQVLRYAFAELGLRRVALGVDEDNARGIRCYEKCGFVREGLLHAHRLRRGQPVNAVTMAVLREEWEDA
ncbi:MAG: N-acetyltransferase [Dehalococcoidia bacterium]|nr:MAG: N-acetyltransferase [Dehalococcoidia bacterium]